MKDFKEVHPLFIKWKIFHSDKVFEQILDIFTPLILKLSYKISKDKDKIKDIQQKLRIALYRALIYLETNAKPNKNVSAFLYKSILNEFVSASKECSKNKGKTASLERCNPESEEFSNGYGFERKLNLKIDVETLINKFPKDSDEYVVL